MKIEKINISKSIYLLSMFVLILKGYVIGITLNLNTNYTKRNIFILFIVFEAKSKGITFTLK